MFGRRRKRIREDAAPPDPELARYILSWCSSTPDARAYAETHLGRFVRTLELTPPGAPDRSILEMGAYMQITPALKTKLGYGEVTGCYLGPLGQHDLKQATSTFGETFSCRIDLFDAEADVHPYPDAAFDTVLCCELFEHLGEDPMHLIAQVNRILKPGGHLLLSTPNIAALRSVNAVLQGQHPGLFTQFTARKGGNKADPRHAREYTPAEIRDVLTAGGFEVTHLETGWYGAAPPDGLDWAAGILAQHNLSLDQRGDCIHAVGRKIGAVKDRYPAWLYI